MGTGRRARCGEPLSGQPTRSGRCVRRSALQFRRDVAAASPHDRRDLLRVPANLLLAPATFGLAVLGRIAARVGLAGAAAWLGRHRPAFETEMAREVSWLVTTELLQLPCVQPCRAHADDALLEMILADPRLSARLNAAGVLPADARERIAATIAGYAERARRRRRSPPGAWRAAWAPYGSSTRHPE